MGIKNLYQEGSPFYLNSTQLVVVMIAFTQGVLQLSDLAIQYLYKDDFKLSPSEVSHIHAITSIPWLVKPIWGMISDNYELFGYKRKSYLMIFTFTQFLLWNTLASHVKTVFQGVSILICIQTCVAFCNVIGEALLVEVAKSQENLKLTQEDKQDHATQKIVDHYQLQIFISQAYTGGLLLQHYSRKTIFQMTSVFPFLLFINSLFLKETQKVPIKDFQEVSSLINSTQNEVSELNKFKQICEFLKQRQIFIPILFIFIFLATPSSGCVMFYFYTNELHFQPDFMGQLKLIHSLGNVLGILIYNKFFRHLPFKQIFISSGIFCSIFGLSQIILVTHFNHQLGIPDKYFSICDSMILNTLAEINMLPVLVMACRLCPKNFEGTMYAILMSVVNFGSMVSYQLGGILTYYLGITEKKFDNLWMLILISNILLILPLPFANYINFEEAQDIAEDDEEKFDDKIYEQTLKFEAKNGNDSINDINETLKYI